MARTVPLRWERDPRDDDATGLNSVFLSVGRKTAVTRRTPDYSTRPMDGADRTRVVRLFSSRLRHGTRGADPRKGARRPGPETWQTDWTGRQTVFARSGRRRRARTNRRRRPESSRGGFQTEEKKSRRRRRRWGSRTRRTYALSRARSLGRTTVAAAAGAGGTRDFRPDAFSRRANAVRVFRPRAKRVTGDRRQPRRPIGTRHSPRRSFFDLTRFRGIRIGLFRNE